MLNDWLSNFRIGIIKTERAIQVSCEINPGIDLDFSIFIVYKYLS